MAFRIPCILLVVFPMVVSGRPLTAQPTAGTKIRPEIVQTDVKIQLLRMTFSDPVAAQRWGRTFQTLGVSMRVRNPVLDDRAEIKEKMLGKIRQVDVIGVLERDGTISFPGKRFSMADVGPLREWINELRAYGAQGTPDGQPAFGLSEKQFAGISAALSRPVNGQTEGLPLTEALALIKLPAEYPIRITSDAQQIARRTAQRRVGNELNGFSTGTALAVVLNQFGLGFRPRRTPEGSIEFAVEPIAGAQDRWPTGWDPKTVKQRPSNVAPKLYKMTPVELEDVPLKDVLDGVAIASEVPILIDYRGLAELGIDPRTLKVSFPRKRTSWSIVLRGITIPNGITRRVMLDERNRAFVWIAPIRTVLDQESR